MSVAGGLVTTVRGISSRIGTATMILGVAVIAVAAASAGPIYYSAAQTSIGRDTLSSVPVVGRGYELSEAGAVAMSFAELTATTATDLGSTARLFSPPIEAREATAFYPLLNEELPLVWRADVCAHLSIAGTCPSQPGEIIVSGHLAALNRWRQGQQVAFPTWGKLTITGTYSAPAASDYWSDRLSTYFPTEYPPGGDGRSASASAYDALFTSSSTLLSAAPSVQGTIVVDATLNTASLVPADVHPLSKAVNTLVSDPQLASMEAVVTSEIPATMSTVTTSWSSLAVPVLVITSELLGLAGLLLYLFVTDATAARGSEIALARLRGYGRWRSALFALSEPTLLLMVALPLGALAGWAATHILGHLVLRPGTPVGFPTDGWVAAGAATAGGLLAVVAASIGILRRPVMEQWLHPSRRPARRGWVVDAVVLTGAVAGLVELEVTGTISSSHQHPLTLLAPALVAIAAAVIGSRLLPLGCSLVAGRSRRLGVAGFLALRQIARRPGGARTTIILALSFSLATFAIGAWALGKANYQRVAYSTLGAPTVLDVSTPQGLDLATAVALADPSGRRATPVEEYTGTGSVTLAVDPDSWNRIAHWDSRPLNAKTVAALAPPAPAPLVINGDRVRLSLDIGQLDPPQTVLTLDVLTPTGLAPTQVQFPALPTSGSVTETAELPPCPCTVEDLMVSADPALGASSPLQGTITLTAVEVHQPTGWQTLPSADLDPSRWQPATSPTTNSTDRPPTTGGLGWTFDVPGVDSASLDYRDRPMPLPAIAARGLTGGRTGSYTAVGLDGENLPANVLATVVNVPGAPADGVIVDRSYAEIAAENGLAGATQQVWLAPGPSAPVIARLKQQGVTVNSVQTVSATTKTFSRSGPGLAQVLFLAEAAATAVLAAAAAILSLYLFARRRRYELAALAVVGIRRRTLTAAVIAEQLIVLSYGALLGIGTGLVTAAVVLRDTPEFQTAPAGVALATFPPSTVLAVALAVTMGLTLAIGAAASASLVRGVTLAELREAPA